MTSSITNFIPNHYNVVFGELSPETKVFLLSETHMSERERRVNSALINHLANPESDILLLERIPSGTQCPDLKTHWQTRYITTPVSAIGWDAGDFYTLMEGALTRDECDIFLNLTDLSSHLQECQFKKDREGEQLTRKQWAEAARDYARAGNLQEKMEPAIVKTFPSRTKSMVDTLKNVESTAGKIFLIAGQHHLIQDPSSPPEYSLDLLREYLHGQPAVILQPKS